MSEMCSNIFGFCFSEEVWRAFSSWSAAINGVWALITTRYSDTPPKGVSCETKLLELERFHSGITTFCLGEQNCREVVVDFWMLDVYLVSPYTPCVSVCKYNGYDKIVFVGLFYAKPTKTPTLGSHISMSFELFSQHNRYVHFGFLFFGFQVSAEKYCSSNMYGIVFSCFW